MRVEGRGWLSFTAREDDFSQLDEMVDAMNERRGQLELRTEER